VSGGEAFARRVIGLAGTAVLALFVTFQVVNPKRPVHENPPGFRDPVAGFELASTPEQVFGILGWPEDRGREETVRQMDLGTRLDFLFLLAYPAFHVGIALLLGARGAPRAAVAAVMAVGDALENRELLRLMATTDPGAMSPALARLRCFTLAKWWALFVASGLIAILVARDPGWWRWSAPFFGLAALVGFASVAYLPAIEMSVTPIAVAWAMTYARAFAASPSATRRGRQAA
jgi:hypothetical protein